MSEPRAEKELNELAAALTALAPTPARLDRDRILYRAGQFSVRRSPWLWQAAAACLALACVGLGSLLLLRPEPAPVVRIVRVVTPGPAPVPEPEPPAPAPPPSSAPAARRSLEMVAQLREIPYYRLQDDLLRWGLDGLPAPRTHAGAAPAAPADLGALGDQLGLRQRAPDLQASFAAWLFSSTGDE